MNQVQNTRLKVALIQADIRIGKPLLNRQHMTEMMEKAVMAEEKPDLIVLPEMWNTGYAMNEIDTISDPEGRIAQEWLSRFAKQHGVTVVGGSIAEKCGNSIYNSMYVFNGSGELAAKYSKLHLFKLMEEDKHLVAGDELVTFNLEQHLKAGTAICYDIRFPELARSLALAGVKVLIVPAQWPHPRLHHWRTLLMARAIENQMYVVACNRTGISGETSFFGHSMIIDPWGEIVAEGGEEEGIITGMIDSSLVDDVRSKIPVFDDRRTDIYAKW